MKASIFLNNNNLEGDSTFLCNLNIEFPPSIGLLFYIDDLHSNALDFDGKYHKEAIFDNYTDYGASFEILMFIYDIINKETRITLWVSDKT